MDPDQNALGREAQTATKKKPKKFVIWNKCFCLGELTVI